MQRSCNAVDRMQCMLATVQSCCAATRLGATSLTHKGQTAIATTTRRACKAPCPTNGSLHVMGLASHAGRARRAWAQGRAACGRAMQQAQQLLDALLRAEHLEAAAWALPRPRCQRLAALAHKTWRKGILGCTARGAACMVGVAAQFGQHRPHRCVEKRTRDHRRSRCRQVCPCKAADCKATATSCGKNTMSSCSYMPCNGGSMSHQGLLVCWTTGERNSSSCQ